ncbi:MAG: hypothetical protein PHQ65_11725 [Bacteroidales bacterium]|nr:hypothetical protein [Bacteroidales bacterium]MDD3665926.1 hypothetical protein [Bacteroidales bacterium]
MKCINSIVKITVFLLLILSAMILPKNSSSQQATTLRIVKWNGTVASSTNSMLFETAIPAMNPSNARLGFPYYTGFEPNSLLDLRATSNTPLAFSATSRTINGKTTSVELVNDLVPMNVTGSDSLLFKFTPASNKNVVFDNSGLFSSFRFYATTQIENPAKGGQFITTKLPVAEIGHNGVFKSKGVACLSLSAGVIETESLIVPTGAGNGYLMVSNASGKASWENPLTLFPSANLWHQNDNNYIYTSAPGVVIGNHPVVEKFQVGSLLTFHDGANRKAISYNYNPSTGNPIVAGASSSMEFQTTGDILFKHSSNGSSFQEGLYLLNNGTVGIKTRQTGSYTLAVNGVIGCKELNVEITSWPDYVFSPHYDLLSLSEVERFVATNGHLPGVPSAREVESDGVGIGEMQATLLKKVEELTLYLMTQQRTIESQQSILDEQQKTIDKLLKLVDMQ